MAYIISLLVLSNCSNNTSIKKPEEALRVDTLILSKDLNLFAKYESENEYQFIAESNGQILKSQMMKKFQSGLPKVEKFENNWVYLRGGCGSSCFYAYMLPVNIKGQDSLKTYMFPLFVDQKKNIIVYCIENTVMIENYGNGKSVSFKDERLVGPYCGFSIEKMNITGRKFVFEINLNNTLIEEIVDIKSLL